MSEDTTTGTGTAGGTDPNSNPQDGEPAPEGTQGQGNAQGTQGTNFTERDRHISRLNKEAADWRGKAQAFAKELDELKRAGMSEAEKLRADHSAAVQAAAEAQQRAAQAEARALRSEVAGRLGLPPALAKRLVGTTAEEIEEDAKLLLAEAGIAPQGTQGPPRRTTDAGVRSNGSAPGQSPNTFIRDLVKR
jgi:hypothetical protein